MNVNVPGMHDQETHYWFFGIIGGMVIVSILTAAFIWALKLKEKDNE
jgi:Mg2+ and Co2+ transporter CorA